MPLAVRGRHPDQRDLRAGVGERVPDPRLGRDAPADDQPLARAAGAVLVPGLDPDFQGAHRLRPPGPVPQHQAPPARRRLGLGPLGHAPPRRPLAPGGRYLAQVADHGVRGHVEDGAQSAAAQFGPEGRHPAELVIPGLIAAGHGTGTAVEQLQAEASTLPERHRLRDVRRPAALGVRGPLPRQVQLPVERGITVGGDVGQEDADLAVFDLAQPPAPLPGDAAGVGAGRGSTAGVEDQHGLGVGQLLGDGAAQVGQDGLVFPAPGADEVWHGLAGTTGLGGDGLGRLALQVAAFTQQDDMGQGVLRDAIAARQIALQERVAAAATTATTSGPSGTTGRRGRR